MDAVNLDLIVIVFTVKVFPERVVVFIFVNVMVDAVTCVALTTLETILLPIMLENDMFPLMVEPVMIEKLVVLP